MIYASTHKPEGLTSNTAKLLIAVRIAHWYTACSTSYKAAPHRLSAASYSRIFLNLSANVPDICGAASLTIGELATTVAAIAIDFKLSYMFSRKARCAFFFRVRGEKFVAPRFSAVTGAGAAPSSASSAIGCQDYWTKPTLFYKTVMCLIHPEAAY